MQSILWGTVPVLGGGTHYDPITNSIPAGLDENYIRLRITGPESPGEFRYEHERREKLKLGVDPANRTELALESQG